MKPIFLFGVSRSAKCQSTAALGGSRSALEKYKYQSRGYSFPWQALLHARSLRPMNYCSLSAANNEARHSELYTSWLMETMKR